MAHRRNAKRLSASCQRSGNVRAIPGRDNLDALPETATDSAGSEGVNLPEVEDAAEDAATGNTQEAEQDAAAVMVAAVKKAVPEAFSAPNTPIEVTTPPPDASPAQTGTAPILPASTFVNPPTDTSAATSSPTEVSHAG